MNYLNRLYFQFRNHFSCHFPKLYSVCDRRKAVVKFFLTGFCSGAVDLIFLFIFYDLFSWPIVFSTTLAFIMSFLFSFSLQKFWTFRNLGFGRFAGQLALYMFNVFVGLNLNGFLMHLAVNRYDLWYLLAQVLVNVILGVYNFFIYKFIIFRNEKNEISREQKTLERNAGDLA